MRAKSAGSGMTLTAKGDRWTPVSAHSDDVFALSYMHRLTLKDKGFEIPGAAAVININGRKKTGRRKLILKFGVLDPNLEDALKRFETSARHSKSKEIDLTIDFFSSDRHSYQDLFSPLLLSEAVS